MTDHGASGARVRRAFEAAWGRMVGATTVEDAEDELSNLLCQLYRLGELAKRTIGGDAFYAALKASDQGRAANAALWARKFDTHHAVVVADLEDIYTNYFTTMYGALAWRPLDQLPEPTAKQGQHLDYGVHLSGRPVLDTTRRAFDTLAEMI
jgi:hypothetical protein